MIPLSRPWVGKEEFEALKAPIERAWLMQGPEVTEFEKEFASYIDVSHAVAVSSGTAALHLMLLACGIGPGDEVIVPSHSFIATSNAIRYVGATVVFVDIQAETLNLQPEAVFQALSPRTKAILAVHQFGMPCDLKSLSQIAQQAGVPLLEDSACAIGSEICLDGEWHRIGSQSHAASFSFHPRKLLTCGEGGMIVTTDSEIAGRVRMLRQHGMGVSPHDRHSQNGSAPTFLELGYNFRLSDLAAAVGRVQLKRMEALLERRTSQFDKYHRVFGHSMQLQPDWAKSNRQSAALRLNSPATFLIDFARSKGVCLGGGILNSHETPAYSSSNWLCRGSLEHSEAASRQTVILPLYHELTDQDQETVIRVVEEGLSQSRC